MFLESIRVDAFLLQFVKFYTVSFCTLFGQLGIAFPNTLLAEVVKHQCSNSECKYSNATSIHGNLCPSWQVIPFLVDRFGWFLVECLIRR